MLPQRDTVVPNRIGKEAQHTAGGTRTRCCDRWSPQPGHPHAGQQLGTCEARRVMREGRRGEKADEMDAMGERVWSMRELGLDDSGRRGVGRLLARRLRRRLPLVSRRGTSRRSRAAPVRSTLRWFARSDSSIHARSEGHFEAVEAMPVCGVGRGPGHGELSGSRSLGCRSRGRQLPSVRTLA